MKSFLTPIEIEARNLLRGEAIIVHQPGQTRQIYEIAREIRRDWKKVYFGAVPYLEAMHALNDLSSHYAYEDATSIINRFLSNASAWRGETARRVKAELNTMLKKR
jgi:hypothetical protein